MFKYIENDYKVLIDPYMRKCPHGVMVKVLDCGIISKFKFQAHYYVRFWTNTLGERHEPPYPPSYGLNSITTVLEE